MAVPKQTLFLMLQAAGVTHQVRPANICFTLKGKKAWIDLQVDYKIRDIRCLVGQLDIDKSLVKKFIPQF